MVVWPHSLSPLSSTHLRTSASEEIQGGVSGARRLTALKVETVATRGRPGEMAGRGGRTGVVRGCLAGIRLLRGSIVVRVLFPPAAVLLARIPPRSVVVRVIRVRGRATTGGLTSRAHAKEAAHARCAALRMRGGGISVVRIEGIARQQLGHVDASGCEIHRGELFARERLIGKVLEGKAADRRADWCTPRICGCLRLICTDGSHVVGRSAN